MWPRPRISWADYDYSCSNMFERKSSLNTEFDVLGNPLAFVMATAFL